MRYTRFEELPVWQAAIEFAIKVFEFTDKSDFKGVGDVKNQLERAAVSISNNIAEGYERGSNTELIQYLYIAKGSAGESRSMLCLCDRLPKFQNFKSDISNLKLRVESVSKQLNGWIESLKNSEIKGAKFLNDKERERYRRKKDLEEFDTEMAKYREELLETLKKREEESARQRGEDF